MPLYFAYGSNLDERQMDRRCPGAARVAVGSLNNYRMAFTIYSAGWDAGAADVLECPGERVWGVVFQITDYHLEALDRFEGYPGHYGRFVGQIDTSQGMVGALIYTAAHKQSFVPPRSRYVKIIREAAIRYGFPDEYLRMLDGVPTVDK